MTADLYCPRCDRRLTPDHRCLSRRIFLFAGLGAGIASGIGTVPPKYFTITEHFCRAGDRFGKPAYLHQVFAGGAPIRSEFIRQDFPFAFVGNDAPTYVKRDRLATIHEMNAMRNLPKSKNQERYGA